MPFPRPEGTPRQCAGPHIDGYDTPDNGLPNDGVVYNFNDGNLRLGTFKTVLGPPDG